MKNFRIFVEIIKDVVIILLVGYIMFFNNRKSNIYDKYYAYMYKDSLKYYKNKLGNVVDKNVFNFEKKKYFAKLKTKDSLISTLQKQVKYYKRKAIRNATIVKQVVKFDTIIKQDTLYFDKKINLTYKDKYADLRVTGYQDTVKWHIRFPIKFSTIRLKEKGKEKIRIITDNPYAKIQGVNSFDFYRPKRWNIGIQGGVGITPKGIQPYIGFGLQYNIKK